MPKYTSRKSFKCKGKNNKCLKDQGLFSSTSALPCIHAQVPTSCLPTGVSTFFQTACLLKLKLHRKIAFYGLFILASPSVVALSWIFTNQNKSYPLFSALTGRELCQCEIEMRYADRRKSKMLPTTLVQITLWNGISLPSCANSCIVVQCHSYRHCECADYVLLVELKDDRPRSQANFLRPN